MTEDTDALLERTTETEPAEKQPGIGDNDPPYESITIPNLPENPDIAQKEVWRTTIGKLDELAHDGLHKVIAMVYLDWHMNGGTASRAYYTSVIANENMTDYTGSKQFGAALVALLKLDTADKDKAKKKANKNRLDRDASALDYLHHYLTTEKAQQNQKISYTSKCVTRIADVIKKLNGLSAMASEGRKLAASLEEKSGGKLVRLTKEEMNEILVRRIVTQDEKIREYLADDKMADTKITITVGNESVTPSDLGVTIDELIMVLKETVGRKAKPLAEVDCLGEVLDIANLIPLKPDPNTKPVASKMSNADPEKGEEPQPINWSSRRNIYLTPEGTIHIAPYLRNVSTIIKTKLGVSAFDKANTTVANLMKGKWLFFDAADAAKLEGNIAEQDRRVFFDLSVEKASSDKAVVQINLTAGEQKSYYKLRHLKQDSTVFPLTIVDLKEPDAEATISVTSLNSLVEAFVPKVEKYVASTKKEDRPKRTLLTFANNKLTVSVDGMNDNDKCEMSITKKTTFKGHVEGFEIALTDFYAVFGKINEMIGTDDLTLRCWKDTGVEFSFKSKLNSYQVYIPVWVATDGASDYTVSTKLFEKLVVT